MSTSTNPPKGNFGRPPSQINVRFTGQNRELIISRAQAAGMSFEDYLRKYYWELVNEGLITPEVEVKIPNPGPNPYQSGNIPLPPGAAPQTPYQQQYPQQPQYYNPYAPPPAYAIQPTVPHGPDQMDLMFADLRKMWLMEIMTEMMQGKKQLGDLYNAYRNTAPPGVEQKKEFTMEDMMKWQTMMNMQERQYQQQMMALQQQREAAVAKGDKEGESNALQLITALATTQAQQSQNNMQQMMAMMQMANNTQQTMYTTALTAQTQAQDRQAQERIQFQQQMQGLQNTLTQTQMQALQAASANQIEVLKVQMENIRNVKDPLTQLIELDAMRKNSPLLDAAFKGAFGIKEGGGIGEMIPKLKELGIDKVIDKIGQALPALAGNLMGGGRQIPAPDSVSPQPNEIPPPMATPTPEQLRALQEARLPQSVVMEEPPKTTEGYTNIDIISNQPAPNHSTQPVPETVEKPKPPETVGYSNLSTLPPAKKKKPPEPPNEPTVEPNEDKNQPIT